jgi:tetratricopeptide (TPR) repeat protein
MLIQVGKLGPVVELLNGVLKLDEKTNQAYIALSSVYAIAKKFDIALQLVNKLLINVPFSSRALKQRAEILSAMQKYSEAIIDLSYVLEYEKTDAGLYYSRGLCYFHTKHFSKALVDFRKATELEVDAKYHNALGNIAISSLYLHPLPFVFRKSIERVR